MVETIGGDFRSVSRLGEDEGALQHGLREECGALRAPFRARRIDRFGFRQVGLNPGGVLADVAVAGCPDRRMRFIRLLRHRSEEAGELRQLALKDRLAELNVAEHTLARVG
jgi:hypothetical protein